MDELKVAIFQGEDLVAEGASMADALQWLLVGRVEVPRKHEDAGPASNDEQGDYRCCSTHCVYGHRRGVDL